MSNHTDNHTSDDVSEPEPPRASPRPRRKRPNGRWSNPASPLQATRFALRMNALDVVKAIRRICPGHGSEPCKLDVAKVSDYETGNRRMGVTHIEAFARFYQRSPEGLGLIRWRDDPEEQTGGTGAPGGPAVVVFPARGGASPQLVVVWVHDRLDRQAASKAVQVLRILSEPATGEDAPEE